MPCSRIEERYNLPESMPSSVEFRNVTVRAASGAAIVGELNLKIADGEAVAFVGRSGAGKTTSLRLINGLARATSGSVLVEDLPLAEQDLIALRRRIGYVIQGAGLLPHRTVYDNIATVPRLLEWDEERTCRDARALMELLRLDWNGYRQRFPRTLSGGEQQRVGIARAMVARPQILLCDEPFGALDPIVRRELQDTFCRLRDEARTTIVFVTHDLSEAMRIGRRIVMFEGGSIVADVPTGEFGGLQHPSIRQFVEAASAHGVGA
jgi:osmoprotectant transport system ATP-binding protein